MFLTSQQIISLTEESLLDFLKLSIPEGLYLDYKAALSGASDKEAKREFLKDVTAFANAAGGQLVLGVKEPAADQSVDGQLVGVDDGAALAQDLERLASSSIDPRIPGLRIIAVPLSSGKYCVVVHIPPSLSRSHMVNHAGHRSFYVRHSESSFPMTTHEIREAVLTSASAEARARAFVEQRLSEARNVIGERKAAFFLQAMPLISPETPWDVISSGFEAVVRGDARRSKYKDYVDLASNVAPRPTIDGLLGQDQREQPSWETEIHRTGYISSLYRDIQVELIGNVNRFVVHSSTCDLFRAFCHLIKEALIVSGTDVPYLVTCAYLNAEGTCVWTDSRRSRFSDPYMKNEILWPQHLRATGTDPLTIAERLCVEMFNAFGFKEIVK